MADLCAIYTLTTPAGNLTINDDTADDFFAIDEDGAIDGLDEPETRPVVKPRPQTDGQYIGPTFMAGFSPVFNGLCVVRSADPYGDQVAYRAAMRALEDDMKTKLRSLAQADGTLTWETYTLPNCRYVQRVAFSGTMIRHRFMFGIASTSADIA